MRVRHRQAAFFALLTVGCGAAASQDSGADAGPPEFVARGGDFASYRGWQSYLAGTQDIDSVHVAGQRTVYINRLPPHGSATFPTGTLIVKEIDGGQTFAMAKRGGDFNSQGALGWEWFELTSTGGAPVIVWRGVAPSSGSMVGNTYNAGSTCNDCHQNASANDFVQAPPLQLSNF
jgi:hypothetical protein